MSGVGENEYREQRVTNMEKLKELGFEPIDGGFERSGKIADIREAFEEEKRVTAAGRLMTVRDMGKSIFADIRDGSDRFQVYAQKKQMGDEAFEAFKCLDIGDIIGVEGALFTTRTDEPTLKIEKWVLLTKALLPLPEKWHGLKDVEARYRQRYLDLTINEESRDLFNKRIACVREIREYLHGRDFQEVETPMMQAMAGGAAAKPFVTHFGALGTDMYLRIAPELYLKRLLVGGFDKVFELNRNFRNEGLDRTHNPEFTMLEIYQAYTDVSGMKEIIHGMITHLAKEVFGTLKVGPEDAPVDLSGEWRTAPYKDLVRERMGDDWYDLSVEDARKKAEAEDLEIEDGWGMTMISQEVFEKLIERTLVNPTFVTRLPHELCPFAKRCSDDDSLIDVFELIIGGKEIAPAYSELNDAMEQRARFMEQADGDDSKLDEDFLVALEHGMPPAGGMGVGIDRLMMVLAGVDAIRDVILFPQLRSKDV